MQNANLQAIVSGIFHTEEEVVQLIHELTSPFHQEYHIENESTGDRYRLLQSLGASGETGDIDESNHRYIFEQRDYDVSTPRSLQVNQLRQPNPVTTGNHCFLLDLPGELRNRIYSFLGFRCSTVICPEPSASEEPFSLPDTIPLRGVKEVSAILCTCKQLYQEARPYIFANNVFFLDNPLRAIRFMYTRHEYLDLIKHVILVVPSRSVDHRWHAVFRRLLKFKNLRIISFRFVDINKAQHPFEYQWQAVEYAPLFAKDLISAAFERSSLPEADRLHLDVVGYAGLRSYVRRDVEAFKANHKHFGGLPLIGLYWMSVYKKFYSTLKMWADRPYEEFEALLVPYEQSQHFPPLHPALLDKWREGAELGR